MTIYGDVYFWILQFFLCGVFDLKMIFKNVSKVKSKNTALTLTCSLSLGHSLLCLPIVRSLLGNLISHMKLVFQLYDWIKCYLNCTFIRRKRRVVSVKTMHKIECQASTQPCPVVKHITIWSVHKTTVKQYAKCHKNLHVVYIQIASKMPLVSWISLPTLRKQAHCECCVRLCQTLAADPVLRNVFGL